MKPALKYGDTQADAPASLHTGLSARPAKNSWARHLSALAQVGSPSGHGPSAWAPDQARQRPGRPYRVNDGCGLSSRAAQAMTVAMRLGLATSLLPRAKVALHAHCAKAPSTSDNRSPNAAIRIAKLTSVRSGGLVQRRASSKTALKPGPSTTKMTSLSPQHPTPSTCTHFAIAPAPSKLNTRCLTSPPRHRFQTRPRYLLQRSSAQIGIRGVTIFFASLPDQCPNSFPSSAAPQTAPCPPDTDSNPFQPGSSAHPRAGPLMTTRPLRPAHPGGTMVKLARPHVVGWFKGPRTAMVCHSGCRHTHQRLSITALDLVLTLTPLSVICIGTA